MLICLGLGIFKDSPSDSNVQPNLRRAGLVTQRIIAALKTVPNKQDTLMLERYMSVFWDMKQDPCVLVQVPTSLTVPPKSRQLSGSIRHQPPNSNVATDVSSSSPVLRIMKVRPETVCCSAEHIFICLRLPPVAFSSSFHHLLSWKRDQAMFGLH